MENLRSAAVALTLLAGGLPALAFAEDEANQGQPEVGVAVTAEMSGDAQTKQAEAIAMRGEALAKRLQGLLASARDDGDIIRVTCLNDKLTQTNATIRTVGQRSGALKEALQTGERDRANHEYTVLTVLAQKFDSLDQQANQCVGQDMFESGAAQVVTQIADGTTDVDPANPGQSVPPAPPSVTVPPPLSGVM